MFRCLCSLYTCCEQSWTWNCDAYFSHILTLLHWCQPCPLQLPCNLKFNICCLSYHIHQVFILFYLLSHFIVDCVAAVGTHDIYILLLLSCVSIAATVTTQISPFGAAIKFIQLYSIGREEKKWRHNCCVPARWRTCCTAPGGAEPHPLWEPFWTCLGSKPRKIREHCRINLSIVPFTGSQHATPALNPRRLSVDWGRIEKVIYAVRQMQFTLIQCHLLNVFAVPLLSKHHTSSFSRTFCHLGQTYFQILSSTVKSTLFEYNRNKMSSKWHKRLCFFWSFETAKLSWK